MNEMFRLLFSSLRRLTLLLVFFTCLSFVGCASKSANDDSQSKAKDTLSLESALAMIEAEDSRETAREKEDSLEGMYAFYRSNNSIASDPESACNQGSEPLTVFVDSFLKSPSFRASRLSLSDEVSFYTDTLRPYTLKVLTPDSTGFFAGWNYVSKDTAMFLSGWLNSEVLEEITLVRESEEKEWRVADYFSLI